MSRFTECLSITPHGDGERWVTMQELPFEIGCKGSRLFVTVPAGAVTDMASVPRILWPIIQPHSPRFAAAYVLHDHLCDWQDFDRATADAILRNALIALGANRFYAGLIYAAVSLFRIANLK